MDNCGVTIKGNILHLNYKIIIGYNPLPTIQSYGGNVLLKV